MTSDKGKKYKGLSKITYILNCYDSLTKEELYQCKESLIRYISDMIGESDSHTKSVDVWERESYKLEIGAGKFEKYTGSKDKSVAIVITAKNILSSTNEINDSSDINIVGLWKTSEPIFYRKTYHVDGDHPGHYYNIFTEFYPNGKLRIYEECIQDGLRWNSFSGTYEYLNEDTILVTIFVFSSKITIKDNNTFILEDNTSIETKYTRVE